MRVIIAEKPSLARAIAAVLPGDREDRLGYIQVGNDCVTWCYGHLLELAEPKDYNPAWARWNAEHLPYRVNEWQVKPKTSDGVSAQLKVIRKLLDQADVAVNAGDPDREGQMLVDEVLEYFGCRLPVKRLLLNATDPASARKAVAGLRDNREFANLFASAKCRSRADWLVGMNLTVAATKWLADDTLVSVGRVQTPALALVVRRDLEIEGFQSRKFWDIEVEVETSAGVVVLRHSPREDARIWDKAKAQSIVADLLGHEVDLTVESKEVSERPPKLFTLPSFQKDAGRLLKWGAKKALDVLQSLYEKQLTTYPRTECEYLPAEQKGDAIKLGEMVLGSGAFDSAKALAPHLAPRDAVYDSSKVAEHHAVIVTGKRPNLNALEKDLADAWALVAKRFLMSLLPDYRYRETRVSFSHVVLGSSMLFGIKGEIPLNQDKSWLALGTARQARVLPPVKPGERGRIIQARPVEGKTTPPEPYTEGTLIEDMNSVAKYVSDPKLKQILRENSGIGTAATQAGIIETLKKRGFCVTAKGKLRSTLFGRSVVEHLPSSLMDPGLTAAWEEALKQVAEGKYDPGEFMRRVGVFVDKRLEEMRLVKGKARITKPASPSPESPSESSSNPTKSSSRPARKACKSTGVPPAVSSPTARR